MITVSVKGMDKVLATLKKLSNGEQLADEAVRKTALNSQIDLVKESMTKNPKWPRFGAINNVSKRWTNPLKLGTAKYQVSNNYKTVGGKYNVVDILDKGHKKIVPINANSLYIPLNSKAAMKKPGAAIPKQWVRKGSKNKDGSINTDGDYVFCKSIPAMDGRHFIEKNIKAAQSELKSRLMAAIKGAIK